MDESILNSIKKLLGIAEFDTSFDQDIIIHINTILVILWQMGVGPTSPLRISGPEEKWSDFAEDLSKIEMVKSYIHLRVAQLFDPTTSTAVDESRNNLIKELEWRLYVSGDSDIL